jgi:hypothetical protein
VTTALTATCPTCGSTQGKICRDGGDPTSPHLARRTALTELRNGSDSVFMVIRTGTQFHRGDLIVGTPPHPGSTAVTIHRRLDEPTNDTCTIGAATVVWVGWADEFNPNLFDPLEALEAFPA